MSRKKTQKKEEILIRELDVNIIRPNRATSLESGGSKIVVIGKPGTGKTTLITSLLYEKSDVFPAGMVCSGTEDSNHHYGRIFPSTFVYNGLDVDRVESYMKRQKIAKTHIQNPWSVLLLDDCTDDPKIFNTQLFRNLMKNGRHYGLLFILSLQYCMDVKPWMRSTIDGVFILRETNAKTRKSLYENYASVIPTFDLFNQIMDSITGDYTALYIHNMTQSNSFEDCVYWYKAKHIPEHFRFGCQQFWDFHNERYNTSYQGDDYF